MTESQRIRARLEHHLTALAVEIGPRAALMGHGLLRAEQYLNEAFVSAGLVVKEQRYEYFGREVANLIASDGGVADENAHYLIGAHYDSVPGTPGADDNASAVAVMLTLAERSAGRGRPVRFAAFTLEEPPAFATKHQGSRMYLRHHRQNLSSIAGAIILEMVGYTSPQQHYPLVLLPKNG